MKNIFISAAVAMAVCALASCDAKDGDWPPIIVNKTKVELPLSGGKDSVCITKNYTGWWICDLSSNGEYAYDRNNSDTVSINGLTAIVPADRKSWVIIEAEPSSQTKTWSLVMECGDAFRSISITQK